MPERMSYAEMLRHAEEFLARCPEDFVKLRRETESRIRLLRRMAEREKSRSSMQSMLE